MLSCTWKELNTTTLHTLKSLFLLLLCLAVAGCNSKFYQNLTARYNGYFYANLRLEEVYRAIEEGYQYDYNEILKVYPEIDSATVNANKSKLEDAFKKASKVVEWHKTSDYVDDGYLIVGKIRHLQAEFGLAISTLKYINQTSDDDDTRHAALIVLMRVYMDAGEQENAEKVANFLSLEALSETNLVNYKITSAFHYQRLGEIQEMAINLAEVVALVKNKDERSRINFILGQVFQQQGAKVGAFEFYKASLAGTPPYELDFHARLNMLQVSDYKGAHRVSKIRKSYAKMLKDGKNREYEDKIYYEMGLFEQKQSNYDLALNHYLEAVAVEQPQPLQKSLSYLRAGELYYDIFQNYELASAYYDSAITALPAEAPEYENVFKRQKILGELVKNLKIIREKDSLLSLAEMNPVSLDAFLDVYLDEQEELAKEQARKEKRAERVNAGINRTRGTGSAFGTTANPGDEWYFYNEAAMSQGQLQFKRQWGDRALEDDWRRFDKESFNLPDEMPTLEAPELEVAETLGDIAPSVARQTQKEKLLAGIPTSPEAKEQAQKEIEEAYFNLGDIYRNGLEQEDKGAACYKTLITEYPTTQFKLDALFALYSIYLPKDVNRAEIYKQQIIREFSDSLKAKILIDPQYIEKKEARSRRLQKIYAGAYHAYENGDYLRAAQIINEALDSFKDVDFLPAVELLAAILKAKTEGRASHQAALQAFVEKYTEGPLYDEANGRLEALAGLNSENKPKDDEFLYSEDFKQIHLMVLLFNRGLNDEDSVLAAISRFNEERFAKSASLRTSSFTASYGVENTGVILISTFTTKSAAENYHALFKKKVRAFLTVSDKNFNSFAISGDNFTTLAHDKRVDLYLKFHKRFYK